jgi:hypothetical protein
MPQVSITLLDGRDPLTEDLASRHAAAWGHLYTNWDNSKALAEFRPQKADGSLPATLVLSRNNAFEIFPLSPRHRVPRRQSALRCGPTKWSASRRCTSRSGRKRRPWISCNSKAGRRLSLSGGRDRRQKLARLGTNLLRTSLRLLRYLLLKDSGGSHGSACALLRRDMGPPSGGGEPRER